MEGRTISPAPLADRVIDYVIATRFKRIGKRFSKMIDSFDKYNVEIHKPISDFRKAIANLKKIK